ncbi:MAG: NADH-quinone oxidoreductase subunit NuoE [Eudoraea sp.]|nr:NADH-quinone oxidoreductase subunit NuoE [Eudoraea sp.]
MTKSTKEIFKGFKGTKNDLIPLLQHVQEEYGFLSENSMEEVAAFLRIPLSKVWATATFYTQFRFKPIGKKHIMVCRGTACHVKGAPRIMEELETQLSIVEGETSEDGEHSLESVACIGACGLAPCVTINEEVKGRLTPKMVEKILVPKEKGGKNG